MVKPKKKIMQCLLVAACLMISTSFCYAGTTRCHVVVDLVGSTSTTAQPSRHVFLAHKTGGTCTDWEVDRFQNNFVLPSDDGDAMLAVILTAASLDKPVYIHTTNDKFVNWSIIEQAYLAP